LIDEAAKAAGEHGLTKLITGRSEAEHVSIVAVCQAAMTNSSLVLTRKPKVYVLHDLV
jgi:hypothetical protein